jgi:hypothetical protein
MEPSYYIRLLKRIDVSRIPPVFRTLNPLSAKRLGEGGTQAFDCINLSRFDRDYNREMLIFDY